MNQSNNLEQGEASDETVITTNQSEFDQDVIEKSRDVPVLVDFWAEWCQPCKELGPRLEKVAANCEKDFVLAKLNIEDNQKIAQKQGIRSIPNVKMYKDGKEVGQFVGALSESQIRDKIKDMI